jgi:hypothetical protein
MRRILVELLIVVILGGAVYGAWAYQDRRRREELAAQAATAAATAADLRGKAQFWAEALTASEAEAVFRAFLAGIAPAVLAARDESVEQSAVALLDLRGIDFVHLLRPDGSVLYSSDAKLATAGSAGERGAWALAASELTTRAGDTRGVTEIAAPVMGPDGPAAFLWIGYRTGAVEDETRPQTLAPATP